MWARRGLLTSACQLQLRGHIVRRRDCWARASMQLVLAAVVCLVSPFCHGRQYEQAKEYWLLVRLLALCCPALKRLFCACQGMGGSRAGTAPNSGCVWTVYCLRWITACLLGGGLVGLLCSAGQHMRRMRETLQGMQPI